MLSLLRGVKRRLWGGPLDRVRRFLNPPEPPPAAPPLADVAGLMAAVREETARSRDRAGPRTSLPNPVFLDTTFPDVDAALLQVGSHTDIGRHMPPVEGTTTLRRQLHRLITACVHRFTQYLTRPQRAFNKAASFVLARLHHGQAHCEAAQLRLADRLRQLETVIGEQAERIRMLERQLEARQGGSRPC